MNNNFNYFNGTKRIDTIDFSKNFTDDDGNLAIKSDYNPINNRLNDRIFYDKDGNVKYIEVFKYTETLVAGESIPEEKCISKLYKPGSGNQKEVAFNQNIIGFRFYATGYDHVEDGYFTLVKKNANEDKYIILEEEQVVDDDGKSIVDYSGNSFFRKKVKPSLTSFEIMNTLFKNDSKGKRPYLITGNYTKALAFFITLEKVNVNNELYVDYSNLSEIKTGNFFKDLSNNSIQQILKSLILNTPEKYRNEVVTNKVANVLSSNMPKEQKYKIVLDNLLPYMSQEQKDEIIVNKILNNILSNIQAEHKHKKIIAIPVLMYNHATTLLIDNSSSNNNDSDTILSPRKRFYLFDSSLAHCKGGHPKVDYFGENFSMDTNLLNKYSLQINGNCTYWNYCFLKILSENPEYNTFNKIEEDFNSGRMQLRLALEMSKIFDNDDIEEEKTIIERNNENEINDNIFLKFKFGDKWYGINKDIRFNNFLKFSGFFDSMIDNNQLGMNQINPGKLEVEVNLVNKLKEKIVFNIKTQIIFQNTNRILKSLQRKLDILTSVIRITEDNKSLIFKDWKQELSDDEKKKIKTSTPTKDECGEAVLNILESQRNVQIDIIQAEKEKYIKLYNRIFDEFGKYLENERRLECCEKEINKLELIVNTAPEIKISITVDELEKSINSTKNKLNDLAAINKQEGVRKVKKVGNEIGDGETLKKAKELNHLITQKQEEIKRIETEITLERIKVIEEIEMRIKKLKEIKALTENKLENNQEYLLQYNKKINIKDFMAGVIGRNINDENDLTHNIFESRNQISLSKILEQLQQQDLQQQSLQQKNLQQYGSQQELVQQKQSELQEGQIKQEEEHNKLWEEEQIKLRQEHNKQQIKHESNLDKLLRKRNQSIINNKMLK